MEIAVQHRQKKHSTKKLLIPGTVHFPLIMFCATVTKEFVIDTFIFAITTVGAALNLAAFTSFLGAPLTLTGILLGVIFNLVFTFTLVLWFFLRRSRFKKRILLRFVVMNGIAIFVSLFPIIRFFIPEYTILILLVYHFEIKEADRIYASLKT